MEQLPPQEQHLLLDLEDTHVRASGGKRFGNYIIDILLFYAFLFVIGIFWGLTSPETVDSISEFSENPLLDRLATLVMYALFMFGQEAIFKGRSVGKFITGTRAVNLDGSTITIKTAMLRALSRAVPFCVFSALGTPCIPWQDKWTDTMVIDIKRSTNLAVPEEYK